MTQNHIRDYVHVCDLVDAHLLGLKWLQSGRGSRVFNLGTGDGFSVLQVIDQAKHVTNRPVPVTHGARRPRIVPNWCQGRCAQRQNWGGRLIGPT